MAALTLARRSTRVRGGYSLASVLPSPPSCALLGLLAPPLRLVPESWAVAILGLEPEPRALGLLKKAKPAFPAYSLRLTHGSPGVWLLLLRFSRSDRYM